MSKEYIEQAVQTLSNQWYGDKVDVGIFEHALQLSIDGLKYLDAVKKAIFYGKDSEDFILVWNNSSGVQGLPDRFDNRTLGETTIHGILGVATEAGELLEALRNIVIAGADADKVNIKEELGDIFWYQAILAKFHGFTFEEVEERNIAKLRKRFPDGFKSYDAINRDLVAEREVLESKAEDTPLHIKLSQTTDAQVWAKEFLKVLEEKQPKLDEGFMIAWFANAIETAKDIERQETNEMLDARDI